MRGGVQDRPAGAALRVLMWGQVWRTVDVACECELSKDVLLPFALQRCGKYEAKDDGALVFRMPVADSV